jgi:L-amino acid N-acyltransferase YncA
MIRDATLLDAETCLKIYSPYIIDSIVSFEYDVPSVEEYEGRLEKIIRDYPWLVYEEKGVVEGFAYGSCFRTRTAYQWSVETSVYISQKAQGQGVGRKLYGKLFEILVAQGFINAYAGISLPNEQSVKFHETMGFSKVGLYEGVGFKNGKWIDVGFWFKKLKERTQNPKVPARFK